MIKKISILISLGFITANLAMAEASVNNTNKLSFDFGGVVSEFVKSTSDAVTNVFKKDFEQEQNTPDPSLKKEGKSTQEQERTKVTKKDLNTCEIYDATYLNTIDLDLASTKAFDKIDKIDETIDTEMSLREEIFFNANIRKLTDLQKREKVVFKEMKDQLQDAREFYKNVNEKVLDVNIFLENNDCDGLVKETKENTREPSPRGKKAIKQLNDFFDDTGNLIDEEESFRKDFTTSLKDKMSVLQKDVKDVKENKDVKSE